MSINKQEIPILSFFSGAGFLDIGFLQTGNFHIPWHNECYESFANAYEYGISQLGYNSSSAKVQSRGRMENLRASAILKQAFGTSKPRMFGVIGGPPCPDFSAAGRNHGYKGRNGRLMLNFSNMILNLRPTFFLIENVPGLLETRKHRLFLFSVLKKLGASYAIDLRVLNALEYGVPQNRRRVFVVGIFSKWLARHYPKPHRDVINASSNKITGMDISENLKIKDVHENLSALHWFPWPRPKFPNALNSYHWGKRGCAPNDLLVSYQFSKINGHPNSNDMFRAYSRKFRTIKAGDTTRKSFKRLHPYWYSPNVAYGNNEVHLHPTEPRRVSVSEALVLQSAPEEYSFPADMSLTDKFKAISNGVPILLAENIATSFLNFFTGENHDF